MNLREIELVNKYTCTACGAKPGEMCRSTSMRHPGEPAGYTHIGRDPQWVGRASSREVIG